MTKVSSSVGSVMYKTATQSLPYATWTTLEPEVLQYLATFVVIEYKGTPLLEQQIKMQYEFLTRTVHLTLSDWDKYVEAGNCLRTAYTSIFRDYKTGDFEASTILWLEKTEALEFPNFSRNKTYLYYRLTEPLVDWLEINCEY